MEKIKVLLLIGFYIVLSELIKNFSEIYIIEQSLEVKLLFFSLIFVALYKVSQRQVVSILVILLIMGFLQIPSGLLIYVALGYMFKTLLIQALSD